MTSNTPSRQAQDRDVESAAAQVVHGIDAFAGVVQAVGDGGGGRLVDQAQHVDAGQLGRVLGGLPLRIVEVRGHGDDGAVEVVVERVLGAIAQGGQDFGADFHRRFLAGAGLQDHHAGGLLSSAPAKRYGSFSRLAMSARPRPMKRLTEAMVFSRIVGLRRLRVVADLAPAVFQVAHHRGQDHPALAVGQAFGHAVAHRRHQRMRRAQVDADGDAPLVRIGRLAGFGNLQQCHVSSEATCRCHRPIVPVARSAPARPGQSAR